jgi:hypothetical protein
MHLLTYIHSHRETTLAVPSSSPPRHHPPPASPFQRRLQSPPIFCAGILPEAKVRANTKTKTSDSGVKPPLHCPPCRWNHTHNPSTREDRTETHRQRERERERESIISLSWEVLWSWVFEGVGFEGGRFGGRSGQVVGLCWLRVWWSWGCRDC